MSDDRNVVDLGLWKAQQPQQQASAEPGEALERVRSAEATHRMRLMLFALVRASGRVRISRADLEAAENGGALDVKLQDNGDLVVSFRA